jgi:hypothetical protein
MNKLKNILSLLVIIISLLFIDEGKTILLICDNMQIHLNDEQSIELEILHHHNFSRYEDDEKLMNLISFELFSSSEEILLFPCFPNKRTEDYKGLVWQPPKSV